MTQRIAVANGADPVEQSLVVHAPGMKIEIKHVNVYPALSEETTAFSATLFVDGKRIAQVSNRGCGSEHKYCVLNKGLFDKFEAHVKSLPPVPSGYKTLGPLPMDADLFIDNLLQARRK